MLSDQEIHAAFAAEAEAARLPGDLLGRIQGDLVGLPGKAPWWRRLRIAHLLEVAAACVVMGAMIALAAYSQGRPPASERPGQTEPANRLSMTNVADAYRVQPGPGGRKRYADLTNPTDRAQVQRLLDAIASAETVDPTEADSYNPRVRQGNLHVELRSGEHIIVRPAMNCAPNQEGGSSCQTTNDKQVIAEGPEPDESKGRVVASPELAAILRSQEWPQGIKTGLTIRQMPATDSGRQNLPLVPGAQVEVLELGLSKQANDVGEVIFYLPPGVFSFRITLPGNPHESIHKFHIEEDRWAWLDLVYYPLDDYYAWPEGLTPPDMRAED